MRPWRAFFVTVAAVVLGPALIRSAPGEAPAATGQSGTRSSFDGAPLEALRSARPDYVVIGNSMAYTNVDPAELGRLTGGGVQLLSWADSNATHWYLALKNYVAASGLRPRAVLVLFRDDDLTVPGHQRPELLARLAHESEPALDALAGHDCRSRGQRLRDAASAGVARVYPASRYASPDWLYGLADLLTQGWLYEPEQAFAFHNRLNHLFDLEHLRPPQTPPIDAASTAEFARSLECTVLPAMLAEAQRAGLRLVLVRVQRRPLPKGGPPPQSAELLRYMAELRAYAAARGVPVYDLTGDPRLTWDLYRRDDHIAPEFMPLFTQVLYDRLGGVW